MTSLRGPATATGPCRKSLEELAGDLTGGCVHAR